MADELETGAGAAGVDTGQDAAPVTPPPARPDFDDGFSDVLSRRDGGSAGAATTTATTTATGAAATPTATATDPQQATAQTPTDPAAAAAAAASASTFPQDLEAQMRRAGLRPQPGETPDAARVRLFDTMHGWNQRLRNDVERATTAYNAQVAAVAELREQLAPLIRAHWQQEQARQTAALAEQIPEPGTPEYTAWLQEQNLYETEQLREEMRLREESQAQSIQEQQIAEEEARVDNYGLGIVSRALGQVEGAEADPEFVNAYTSLTRVALTALRQRFPNAPDEQIREFVAETQRRETREFLIARIDPVQAIKDRYRQYREAFVVAGMGGAGNGSGNGANGNGNGANGNGQPTAAVSVPAPAPVAPPAQPTIGSPNAQRIQAEAAAAARRGPVAAPVASKPVGVAGVPLDALDYESSEDYVEAVLAGLVTEAQRMAPPRRRPRAE